MKIVAIDDSRSDLRQMVDALKSFQAPDGESVTVVEFLDYKKAINYLRRETVDAVVCDMLMGKREEAGLEVIRSLTSQTAIVIVLTGHGNIPNCVETMREGVWDYIEKEPGDGSDSYERLLRSLEIACEARIKRPERGSPNPDMEWIDENLSKLMHKYRGRMVAVLYRRVVDSDKSFGKLTHRVKTAFPFARPTIISIPEKRVEEII